jgi:hypothetical protein
MYVVFICLGFIYKLYGVGGLHIILYKVVNILGVEPRCALSPGRPPPGLG